MPATTMGRAWRSLADLPSHWRRPVASGIYRAEVDGLRFIAIALVVIGHFFERAVRFFPAVRDGLDRLPFGSLLLRPGIGVYLFFTISGFILARQAGRDGAHPLGAPFLKRYFGRRLLRIEPPYIVLLVSTFLIVAASGFRPEQTTHFTTVPNSLSTSLLGSVVYVHDLWWGTYPRLFPPGWSLEVEVQFYLIAPLLFAIFLRARASIQLVLGIAGLLGTSALSLVAPAQIGPFHTGASLLLFAYFFWLGIVLAAAQATLTRWIGRLPVGAGLLGWGGLLAFIVMPEAPTDAMLPALAIRAATMLALTAMFASTFAERSSFRWFCQRAWISLIGGACYSLYLTHLQVLQLLTSLAKRIVPDAGLGMAGALLGLCCVAVSLVGLAFYAAVERPFMRTDWPARLRRRIGFGGGREPRRTDAIA